jgi:hypothetical protein
VAGAEGGRATSLQQGYNTSVGAGAIFERGGLFFSFFFLFLLCGCIHGPCIDVAYAESHQKGRINILHGSM